MSAVMREASVLIDRHLEHLVQRGYAPRSVALYGHIEREFVEYLASRDLQDVSAIDEPLLSGFDAHMKVKHPSFGLRTQRLILIILKNLFRWFQAEGMISEDPAAAIPLPKIPLTYPKRFKRP